MRPDKKSPEVPPVRLRGCWALKKDLKFCQRRGPWLFFCKGHRLAYFVGIGLLVITLLASFKELFGDRQPGPTDPVEYHISVRTEDENGKPIDSKLDTSVKSTISGGGHSWMIDVLRSNMTPGLKLTINATNEEGFLRGRSEITLGRDANQATVVVMKRDRSARAIGRVLDERQRPVIGARIYVWEHEGESTITLDQGQFDIAAHAASGEPIRIHVEHRDFEPEDIVHIAGSDSQPIILTRRPR